LLAIVAVARASTAEMTRWQGWVVRFAHFVRGYRIHGEQRFRYVVPELVLFLLGLGVLLLWLSPFLLVVQVGRAFWVDFLNDPADSPMELERGVLLYSSSALDEGCVTRLK